MTYENEESFSIWRRYRKVRIYIRGTRYAYLPNVYAKYELIDLYILPHCGHGLGSVALTFPASEPLLSKPATIRHEQETFINNIFNEKRNKRH